MQQLFSRIGLVSKFLFPFVGPCQNSWLHHSYMLFLPCACDYVGAMALTLHKSPAFFSVRLPGLAGQQASKFSSKTKLYCSCQAGLVIPNLQADDFRHPLDKQNTAILRGIPGITEIGKLLLGPAAERVMLLENIATAVLVSEKQLPKLHNLVVEASSILGVDVPDLYVKQNPVPNAYTLAIGGRKPFIVIHTSIVELLSPAELQAVIAHELGHLKCDHGIWLTFANIFTLGAYTLPGIGAFIAQSAEEQLMIWLRSAELTCDRAALLVAQDPNVVISVLMKLAGGCPSIAGELNLEEFLKQARSYEEASADLFGWYLRNAQTRQLSHPLPVLRAQEIDRWARGEDYNALLARARTSIANGKLASTNLKLPT